MLIVPSVLVCVAALCNVKRKRLQREYDDECQRWSDHMYISGIQMQGEYDELKSRFDRACR